MQCLYYKKKNTVKKKFKYLLFKKKLWKFTIIVESLAYNLK